MGSAGGGLTCAIDQTTYNTTVTRLSAGTPNIHARRVSFVMHHLVAYEIGNQVHPDRAVRAG